MQRTLTKQLGTPGGHLVAHECISQEGPVGEPIPPPMLVERELNVSNAMELLMFGGTFL